jgi:glycosyltransferase involved in cell wall biosynthesis
MTIGIVSDCNVNYLKPYLFEEFQKDDYNGGDAPSVTNIIEGLILENNITLYIFKLYPGKEIKILSGERLNIILVPQCTVYPWKYIVEEFINGVSLHKAIKPYIKVIDILHAQWSYGTILSIIKWRKKIPVFCSIRDWTPYIFKIESYKNKICWVQRLIIFEYIFKCSDIHFLANSPYTQKKIQKKVGYDVALCPNPVKNSFLISHHRFYPNTLTIVSISKSNDKRKNYIALLQAFSYLLKVNSRAQLILIGSPFVEENPQMIALYQQGLLNNVILKGQISQNEIKEILTTASMLVHPALEETFGNTLIEAMATKLPIIAGVNSGAVTYVLEDGKCGLLCDVSSPDEILNGILLLHENIALRTQLVENAFKRVQSIFSQKAIAQQHIYIWKNKWQI